MQRKKHQLKSQRKLKLPRRMPNLMSLRLSLKQKRRRRKPNQLRR
jgi:hypothetical protein